MVIASATAQPLLRYTGAAVLVSAPTAGDDPASHPRYRPWHVRDADRLAAELAELPGVAAAVPDLAFPVQLVAGGQPLGEADPLDPLGHNWSSTTLGGYHLVDGAAPSGAGQVVASADYGLPVGQPATLLTAGGARAVTVSGTVDGPGVYLADDIAARHAAGSRVIGVVLDGDADRGSVAERAGAVVGSGGSVYTGAERAELEGAADARTRWLGAQLLGVMGVLAAFVSIFVVATTFAFVVQQRRRELALLRTVGATPGQLRRMLLGEAVLVGVIAATAGAGLGALLAPVLGGWLVDAGLEPASWRPRTVAAPLVGSALIGLVVSVLGVWSASRRAARIRPLEALRESVVERRPMTPARWVFGVAGLVLGVAAAALSPIADSAGTAAAATLAVAGLVVAATLLGPVYLPWLVRGLCRPFRRTSGATVELVSAGATGGVRRLASTFAPILLTVASTVLVTGMVATMDSAMSADLVAEVPTPVVVAPAPGSPGLSDAAVEAVAAARPSRLLTTLPTGIIAGSQWLDATGADSGAAGSLLPPDHITVVRSAADRLGWRAGQDVAVTWADGTAGTARVAAVVTDPVPEPGRMLRETAPVQMSRATARAHDPAALTEVAYVDGLDRAAVAALDGTLGALAAETVARTAYQEADAAEEERLVRLFVVVLLALVLAFTTLAIVNTLVMATGERRVEFAVLRLAGAGTGQVLRLVVAEAVLLVALGSALGTAAAIPGLLGIAAGLADDVGGNATVVIPWPDVLAVIAACLVIAVTASVLPARAVVRGAPTRPTGDRDS